LRSASRPRAEYSDQAARVEAREARAGGAVAGAREPAGDLAAGEYARVAQAAHRLQLAVEDALTRVERVHREAPPAVGGHRDAHGRRRLERAQPLAGDARVARAVQRAAGAGERLERRRLGHAADPGRRAAAVLEVVLERQEAAAPRAEAGQAVEHLAQGGARRSSRRRRPLRALRHAWARPLAKPQLASCWSCIPCPG
jgi:hypothetical protein